MTRRRRALLIVLLLAVPLLFFRSLPLWSARLLSRGLTAFFDRPVTVEEVRYTLWPFAVEVRGIRVSGPTPADPPFLEVPRLVAVPALRPLWDRRAVFSRLRIERPILRVSAYKGGGDDIPKLRPKRGGGPLEVRIGVLVIERGEVLLDHQRVPLELELPGFRGRLEEGSGRALGGHLSFGPGMARFGANPPLPVSTEMDLELAGTTIDVKAAHLVSERTDLSYYGRLELAPRPQGDLYVSGPFDMEVLDRHVIHSGFGMKGDARFAGSVTLAGSRINLKGRIDGSQGEFDQVSVPRFGGEVAWNDTGVHVRRLDLAALSGTGVVEVEVPPGSGIARLNGRVQDMDAEALLRAVFNIGSAGLGAAATGDIDLEWPRGKLASLSGVVAADLAARADGRTPVQGRFEWRAEDGVQWIEKADLRTPTTTVVLSGRIERDRRTALEVDFASSDLAVADDLGLRVRRALGNAAAQPLEVAGTGTFRGRWTGTLSDPVYQGRFTGDDLRYLGVPWGHAEWAGESSAREVRSHSLVLRKGAAELWLDGRLESGLLGEQDAVDVAVRLQQWPAADLVQALGWDLDVSGPVSGRARIEGRRSAPVGEVAITSGEGRFGRLSMSDLEVAARLRGAVTEVTTGRARLGGGRVEFRGTVDAEGVYDASLDAADVELSELLPQMAPEARFGGRLSGHAVMQGLPGRPRLEARLTSPRLFLGDEGVGALEASLHGDGNGRVAVTGGCRSARVDLSLAGDVDASAPYAAALDVRMRETSLDPFLRVLQPRWPSAVGLVASGQARLTGPLRDARALEVTAELPDLQFLLPEYPVRNREPVRARVAGGALRSKRLAPGRRRHGPVRLRTAGAAGRGTAGAGAARRGRPARAQLPLARAARGAAPRRSR